MGEEAPEFLQDFPKELSSNGYGLNPEGYRADINLGDKIYVVGGSLGGNKPPSTNIKFFDKSTSLWMVPTVLGIEPTLSEGHSAVLVNNDRILILKRNKLLYDSVWFLEVDTPYVREQKKVLGTEVVAWSKGVISDYVSLPVVITGPSGVGKGTLISKLMKEFPTTFGFFVSHTTRAPREKEMDGVHYHFAERSLMERNIRDGKFLESASVHGNLYGTSIEAVEAVTDIGKRCILDIDVQGARSVRASSLDAIFIFICPPSFEELEKRLRARGTETEEQIQKRLKNAKSELDQGRSPGLFDHFLVNDDLESCYQNLKKLLALDEGTNAVDRPNMKKFNVFLCNTMSKSDQKVVIHSGSNEGGATHPTLIVLDVSSLKGGAPGRTRALKISAICDS